MDPKCSLGYTPDQIAVLTGDREQEFWDWMRGQTVAICQADPQREWVEDTSALGGMRIVEIGPPLCDIAHGAPIVYRWDLERFLAGLPVID